jgi:hypothetical protein
MTTPKTLGVGQPLSDGCAPGRERHCPHVSRPHHTVEFKPLTTHECLKCCWCGWLFCRTLINTVQGEHGQHIDK